MVGADTFTAAVREAGSVLGRFGEVRWLRPASGWYTETMISTIEREGYGCPLGSIYPCDAFIPSARLAAAYIVANTRPGAVIILREGANRGRRAVQVLRRVLPVVLPVLSARGYQVVTLSELDSLGRSAGMPAASVETGRASVANGPRCAGIPEPFSLG